LSPVRKRKWFSSPTRIRQWQLNLVKIRYHVEEALTMKPAAAIRYLAARRARREHDRVLRETAFGWTEQFAVPLDYGQAFGRYALQYAPPPLRARVIVVLPERRMRGACYTGDLGWAELGYDVDLLIVPGDHWRMFMEENAGVLAERLLAIIDARLAQARSATAGEESDR
jgi:thioesterase domain-containing protein